ncbi:hypothetical protein J6590_002988 [Homalodisca vitripennis]|nr:hypothetical protein J6590_002988 [Homalodisca vitripennis]
MLAHQITQMAPPERYISPPSALYRCLWTDDLHQGFSTYDPLFVSEILTIPDRNFNRWGDRLGVQRH